MPATRALGTFGRLVIRCLTAAVSLWILLALPVIAQEAALEALKHGWDQVLKMREQYHRRRDLIVRRFRKQARTPATS